MSVKVAFICRQCGQKDARHRKPSGRVDYRCHACAAAYTKRARDRNREAGIARVRNKEHEAAYERARSDRPEVRAQRAAAMSRYAKDPTLRPRHEARWKLRRAIAAGRIARQPCEVCGVSGTHGHHDDYSKPLDVRWLCPSHHREHHARVGAP